MAGVGNAYHTIIDGISCELESRIPSLDSTIHKNAMGCAHGTYNTVRYLPTWEKLWKILKILWVMEVCVG